MLAYRVCVSFESVARPNVCVAFEIVARPNLKSSRDLWPNNREQFGKCFCK